MFGETPEDAEDDPDCTLTGCWAGMSIFLQFHGILRAELYYSLKSQRGQMATTSGQRANLEQNQQFWQPLLLYVPSGCEHKPTASAFITSNALAKSISLQTPQSTHHWINDSDTKLTIDLVRSLQKQLSFGYAAHEPQLFFVQKLENASSAAQNALLKLLEEPPEHIQIIITTEQPEMVLPTIHSRCLSLSALSDQDSIETEKGAAFYKSASDAKNYSELIKTAETLSDRDDAITVLQQVVHYLYSEKIVGKTDVSLQLIQFVQLVLLTLRDVRQNSNVKVTIEHLLFQSRQSKYI